MKAISNNQFGENLTAIRKKCGLTQEQTIAKMNLLGSPISRSTYSLIEMGRGNIFISDLVALKNIFKVDFSEFFKGIDTAR